MLDKSTTPAPVAGDLLLGAGEIAKFIYGADGPKQRRDVYRNPFGFSFFKHGSVIAALKSAIRAELFEAQQAARAKKMKEISAGTYAEAAAAQAGRGYCLKTNRPGL